MKYLYRWSTARDCWELLTAAAPEKAKIVLRSYKRRDAKGTRFRWTDGDAPKKFRTRRKKDDRD